MTQEKFEILLIATDEATGEIKKYSVAIEGVGKASEKVSEQNQKAKSSFTEIKSAVDLAEKGLHLLQQAYGAVITPTLELASAQRELALAGQIGVEEAGALIQVADDLKIPVTSLKTAFREMAKDGLQPTISNIKDLSLRYQQAESPIEKLKIAQDGLGKSYQELLPLLELAPGKLDKMAAAAKRAGLVMSGEAVKGARDYEEAVDDLSDSFLGLQVSAGKVVIPFVTDRLDGFNLMNEAVATGAINWAEYAGNLAMWSSNFGQGQGQIDALTASINAHNAALDDEKGDLIASVQALRDTTTATYDWQSAMETAGISLDSLKTSTGDVADEVGGLKDKLNDAQLLLAGPVKKENEEYATRQKDIYGQLVDTKAKMDELMLQKHLTPEQRLELDELKTRYGELKQTYQDNADAHVEAGNRIILSIFEQKLAIGGWTKEEEEFYVTLGEKMGLFDSQTKTVLQKANDAFDAFAEGDAQRAYILLSAIYGFPDEKTYKINVVAGGGFDPAAGEVGIGPVGTPEIGPDDVKPKSGGFAEGGTFIVPGSGSGDRMYRVPLEPGEQVTVTPRNQVAMGGGGGQTIIINQTINYPMDYEVATREIADRLRGG